MCGRLTLRIGEGLFPFREFFFLGIGSRSEEFSTDSMLDSPGLGDWEVGVVDVRRLQSLRDSRYSSQSR